MSNVGAEHDDVVRLMTKSGGAILGSMTPATAHLLHMALGITGEAGEIVDAIKKHVVYGQPLNCDNLVEELGDLMFYVSGLRQHLRLSEEVVLQANIDKLAVRYGDQYSDLKAFQRADKDHERLLAEQYPSLKPISDPDAGLDETPRDLPFDFVGFRATLNDQQRADLDWQMRGRTEMPSVERCKQILRNLGHQV
jgi:NTP pyrophosphatase (non-canonical NTP hydrolase)